MKNTLQVIQMEKFVRQSLLYDFYGELLTQTQKSIYEDVVMNDLSYSELAREYGISRQGVFDMMKRCDKKLEDFEKKLKLVEKFENAREKVATIQTEIQAISTSTRLSITCCLCGTVIFSPSTPSSYASFTQRDKSSSSTQNGT